MSTSGYLVKSFPRERVNEHPAIDKLRQAVNMAKTAACLIDDSADYQDDDPTHAAYMMTVAKESAELALSVLEDALRVISQEIGK